MSVKAPEAGPSTKRVKLDTEKEATANSSAASDADEAVSEAGSDEASDSGFSSDVQDEFPDEDLESVDEADEEDEEEDSETEDIKEANARKQGLIKNSKRKRALSPDAFGANLVSLLSAPEPSTKAIAKLNKPLHPTASDSALERKALKVVQAHRHEQREQGHVKDVIAGWGPRPKKPFSQWTAQERSQDWVPPQDPNKYVPGGAEGEKVLRKLAQRGTVKLFNAIKAAQATTEDDVVSSARVSAPPPANDLRRKAITGAGAAGNSERGASPAGSAASDGLSKDMSNVPNLFGTKAKESALANLSKESFLQILKGKSQS